MAQDMAVESTVKEETATTDTKQTTTTHAEGNENDHPAKQEDATGESNTKKDNDGYFGKYSWDSSNKKKEKASIIPSSGAIVDYAWCDGTKAVSVYITLAGLDEVLDDDMKLTLINDNKGVLFKVKNVGGKNRFLKIDELYAKVKTSKIVRKKGQDKVIIRLVKDDEKRKWYNLKEGGSSTYGNDDYEWSDDDESIPPEDAMEDADSEVKVDDKKEGDDEPMEDATEPKESGPKDADMSNE